jgi:hypothetical protein
MREQLIKNIEELLEKRDPEEIKSTIAISVIDLFIDAIDEMIRDEIEHVNKALNNEDSEPDIRQASLCYEALSTYSGLKSSLSESKKETV